ncbi:MAG: 8-oxo-dGTP diphosphatase [Candidatus Pacebacteria bacterium]|nr:8-oxo-dGTP diphosphatase [Candidatus Paceibacterota bacterium]
MRIATLCFLMDGDKILLAKKKRGFGVGKWNGVGGKMQEEETIEQAVLREAKEEIGIDSCEDRLEKAGSIKFYFNGKEDWNQEVHIYALKKWEGEPQESEEMSPKWFFHHEMPFDEMWADDRHWMPYFLSGKRFEGEFYFTEDGSVIEKFDIREIF